MKRPGFGCHLAAVVSLLKTLVQIRKKSTNQFNQIFVDEGEGRTGVSTTKSFVISILSPPAGGFETQGRPTGQVSRKCSQTPFPRVLRCPNTFQAQRERKNMCVCMSMCVNVGGHMCLPVALSSRNSGSSITDGSQPSEAVLLLIPNLQAHTWLAPRHFNFLHYCLCSFCQLQAPGTFHNLPCSQPVLKRTDSSLGISTTSNNDRKECGLQVIGRQDVWVRGREVHLVC